MATVVTFNFTGAPQSWVVPAGVTFVDVDAYGAQGKRSNYNSTAGGQGGRCQGRVTVTPGETLTIEVGGGLTASADYTPGYNGGGQGGQGGAYNGGGGGGATDVRRGGTGLANRVIVAPGGGGRGAYIGGAGGGLTGANGYAPPEYPNAYGRGGGQTAGGAAGTGETAATAGALGVGGNGGNSGNVAGAGGGGGFYGGGGAAGTGVYAGASGGGGSALVPAGGSTTADVRAGHGTVTLTYYLPPSAPGAFVHPAAAEVVNTTDPVEVGAATDPDGDALSYEWDLSTDNGATWTRKRNLTAGVLWTYDYTAEPATTAALWRVRAHDGVVYGPYSTSPLFTVAHNQPPTAPTPTFPVGGRVLDRAQPIELRATFNDPDAGDVPSQSQWRYRQVGAATWTTVTQSGTAQTYTIGATVLAAADYEWQALYYDRLGAVSPWSASAFFTAGTVPPGPTITAPVDGGTVPQTTVLAWTSAAQDAYQARRVADNAGAPDPATIFYDSGVVESPTARDHPLTFETNNRYEHVQVAVRSGGLWSPWVSARVLVSYTPPAVPGVAVMPDDTTATITVIVTNPAPAAGEPAVTSTDILRRVGATGDGIRVAAGLLPDATWVDWTPASRVDYQYRAVVHAANGTSTDSGWAG